MHLNVLTYLMIYLAAMVLVVPLAKRLGLGVVLGYLLAGVALGPAGFAIANNKIYVGDAADYNSNGKVYIYSLTGTLENQQTVGVIPGGFYFN